jgi:hypothetical protein
MIEVPKGELADAPGHDTSVREIVESFAEFLEMDRQERWKLLADLYRDSTVSDAGLVLFLPELLRILPGLVGELQLDVAYVAGSILLIGATDDDLGEYGATAVPYCGPESVKKVLDLLVSLKALARNEADAKEIDELMGLLGSL